jgi:hypothetical protein
MARPKGSLNRETKMIKEMLAEALERAGGSDYFYQQALENPVSFNTLVAKLIPSEIKSTLASDPENPFHVTVKFVHGNTDT